MTTIRDFIRHPRWAINRQSIPDAEPVGRNETQGAADFPVGSDIQVIPPPAAFFVAPDLRGLPTFRQLFNRPRTTLTGR